VKDRRSNSNANKNEPLGAPPTPPPGLPPGYVYDPEMDAWCRPGTLRFWMPPPPSNNPPTIPADFTFDEELQSWIPPGEPSNYDAQAEHEKTLRIIEKVRAEPPIPPEELIVPAGVLDVPASWRKSLSEERNLFSDVSEDGDPHQGAEANEVDT
jgi:hypothetical protein